MAKGVNVPSDPYEILQVHNRAEAAVVKAAYHALLEIHHPDKGGSAEKADAIIKAYKVLSDPKERKKWDATRNKQEGKSIGEFHVLKAIAEGGIGKTYLGEHSLTKSQVCIKHCSGISPDHDTIMINEARAMWDLRHYSFPAVRNLLRLDDDSLALVMSYIPGLTLQQIVEKAGKLDPEHVAWIMERILNALRYIHLNGIVHGDIKPQNIIIQPDDHMVVLVDFGLSLIKPKHDSKAMGHTDYYAPPEQEDGLPLIPETDFYSLGMTMIYALGGKLDHVAKKEIPTKVPEPMAEFIERMIVRYTLSRPNWQKHDLCEEIKGVRMKSFGRSNSSMKPLRI